MRAVQLGGVVSVLLASKASGGLMVIVLVPVSEMLVEGAQAVLTMLAVLLELLLMLSALVLRVLVMSTKSVLSELPLPLLVLLSVASVSRVWVVSTRLSALSLSLLLLETVLLLPRRGASGV